MLTKLFIIYGLYFTCTSIYNTIHRTYFKIAQKHFSRSTSTIYMYIYYFNLHLYASELNDFTATKKLGFVGIVYFTKKGQFFEEKPYTVICTPFLRYSTKFVISNEPEGRCSIPAPLSARSAGARDF